LTELTAGVAPPEGGDGGGRGPVFVALAVVVGVLATASEAQEPEMLKELKNK
jgi:hypothetical protein